MPEIITREFLHRGWNTFSIATIRLEDGQHITRSIEDHGSAICVLTYDPVRRMALLVRQFRAPLFAAAGQEDLLEAIAEYQKRERRYGGLSDGGDHALAAAGGNGSHPGR